MTFRTSVLTRPDRYSRQGIGEIPMRTTAHATQVISPFGSGYVQEHHGDETRRYLARTESGVSVVNIRADSDQV